MKPRVLILYYTFTNQTKRVSDAMAEQFRQRGCNVDECCIEFVDERHKIELPFRPFWRKLFSWLLPQLLGKTGTVRVPEEVVASHYDLVCIGSPTWWVNPAMPIVSFLKSENAKQLLNETPFAVFTVCRKVWWNNMYRVKKMAKKQGGNFVDGCAFCFKGNDLQSALSFISYMQFDENRDRLWGIKIYEFGVPSEGIARAKDFARKLVGGLRAKDDSARE